MRVASLELSTMEPGFFNAISSLIACRLERLSERYKKIVASTLGEKERGWGVEGTFMIDEGGEWGLSLNFVITL